MPEWAEAAAAAWGNEEVRTGLAWEFGGGETDWYGAGREGRWGTALRRSRGKGMGGEGKEGVHGKIERAGKGCTADLACFGDPEAARRVGVGELAEMLAGALMWDLRYSVERLGASAAAAHYVRRDEAAQIPISSSGTGHLACCTLDGPPGRARGGGALGCLPFPWEMYLLHLNRVVPALKDRQR